MKINLRQLILLSRPDSLSLHQQSKLTIILFVKVESLEDSSSIGDVEVVIEFIGDLYRSLVFEPNGLTQQSIELNLLLFLKLR